MGKNWVSTTKVKDFIMQNKEKLYLFIVVCFVRLLISLFSWTGMTPDAQEYFRIIKDCFIKSLQTNFNGSFSVMGENQEEVKFYVEKFSLNVISFASGFVVSVLSLIIGLFRFLRYSLKDKFGMLYIGIFACIFSSYLVSLFGTNAEFTRTAILAIPFVYIFIAMILIEISFKGDKNV